MVWYNRFLFNFLDCNINNIMEEYIMMGFFRITGEFEKPIDEDPMSNCCTAPFTYPGWPDSDMCSKCKEHADIWEEE